MLLQYKPGAQYVAHSAYSKIYKDIQRYTELEWDLKNDLYGTLLGIFFGY